MRDPKPAGQSRRLRGLPLPTDSNPVEAGRAGAQLAERNLQERCVQSPADLTLDVYNGFMAYSLVLPCGCQISVTCDPQTGLVHTRVIDLPGPNCHRRGHARGTRVYLWDILPAKRMPETARLWSAFD